MPGEDGYIRFYLTPKNNTSWTTLTRGKLTPNMIEDNDNTLFVVNGQTTFENAVDEANRLSVRIGNILGTDHSGNSKYSYSKDITHLLRARYSLLKDTEYNNAEGYNPIGEVEDYKVKVTPGFEVNFEMTEDLGVPVDEEALDSIQVYNYVNTPNNMVGTRDENIGLGEYVLQTITITNLSKLAQENQQLKLRINNGVITELVSLESITRDLDLSTNDIQNPENSSEKDIDNIEARIGIINPRHISENDYSEYWLNIKDISGRETLKLTYLMKIVKENIQDVEESDGAIDKKWELIQKAYDKITNIQLAEKHSSMLRDYGENLVGNYSELEDRHYITSGDTNPAYLGEIVNNEDKPKLSDPNDNDGVVFGEVDPAITRNSEVKENILYNNMRNRIKVTTTHSGYISLWLSDGQGNDYAWEDSGAKRLAIDTEPDNEESNKVYVYEVKKGENQVTFIIPEVDLTTLRKVLRVKYAVHKKDLDTSAGIAITGEVEDYPVTLAAGIDVMFGEALEKKYIPIDYGVTCDIDDKSLGDRDGFFASNETVEHTITIVNNVNEEQRDKVIVFNSNIEELFINGYDNRMPFKYVTDISNGEIEPNIVPITKEGVSGNSYQITVKNIKPLSKITIKMKFQIIGEDLEFETQNGKSYIKDRLIYDGTIPDFKDSGDMDHRVSQHQMIQDYGNNFTGNDNSINDARHYITTIPKSANEGISHPAHLGDSVVGEENGPSSDAQDDNGVIFETIEGEDGTENVVYNKLINHIKVSATHKGYINAWLTKKDNPDWEDAIPLQLRLNRDIVPPIGSVDGKNIPLLIETGINNVYFNLEDIMEDAHIPEDRVIRIRYAIDSNDVLEPTGMAKTGEVEDYKIKLISGLDVKFGKFDKEDTNEYKLLDLGIPCEEHTSSSLGARDGYYAPEEIVEHTISIKNLSKIKQYNKEFYFNSNLLEICEKDGKLDYEVISSGGVIEKIEKLPTISTLMIGNNKIIHQYKIMVKEINEVEEITLKVRFKIAGEALETDGDITKSMIRDYLVIDEVDPFEYDPTIKKRIHNQEMKQDLGDNLIGSYELTDDARHYITTGINRAAWTHPARLGMNILPEEKPEISSDNDGVVLDKRTINNNEVNVIYNDMRNEITIKATHKGYVSAWLSKGRGSNYSWSDAIPLQLKLDTDAETQSTDTNVTPLVIEAGERIVAFDLDDVLADSGTSEERVIRVRYSPISEEEVKEPIGMATAGEVEDYPVVVMKGSRVKFGEHEETTGYKPLDLGVIYKDNGDNNIYMGAKDGYYALNEIIEHTITVYNETNQRQEYQDILLDTNILGEFVEINPDDIDYAESTQGIQPLNLSDNNIQYTIRVKDIPPRVDNIDGYRTVRVRFKVTKENLETGEYKYHIKDRVITIDEEHLPEHVPFDMNNQVSLVEMERDYGEKGEGFFEKDEDENVARHYIIGGISKASFTKPAHLGATIIPEDKPQSSTDNDGVIFNEINTRAKTNGEVENILFNELVNALEITTNSEIGGYITLWLSNEDASDWSTAENLSIIVGDEKEETSTTKVYKIAKGKNRVRFELPKLELDPELHEARRVLRVRFALDADDVKTSIGMAKTGEVEDYQVVIKEGLDVKFGEFDKEDANEYKLLDLGIPCKVHTSNSLGERDGYYAPTEIVEHTISIKNLSNDPQTDKEFYLYSNLLDIQEKAEGSLDYEIITDEANGVIEKIEKLSAISTLMIGNNKTIYGYKIKVKSIEANKQITLKVRFEINGEALEDIGESKKSFIRDRLVLDGVEPRQREFAHRIHNQEMKQDLGDNLIEGYTISDGANSDARHYITTGMNRAAWTHPARLGMDILPEENPQISSDNDGVEFSTIKEDDKTINILYNNVTNQILVKPTHAGYISVWLSDRDCTSWENSKRLSIRVTPKGDIYSTNRLTPEIGNVLEITDEILKDYPNGVYISFDLGDELEGIESDNRIIRVRYSPISEEEVDEPTGMAVAGEVEDYEVRIISGIVVKFGDEKEQQKDYQPEDLGVMYNYTSEDNGMPSVATYGNNDGNISPKEIIEHQIAILNKTNSVQRDLQLIYNTNIAGEFIELVEEKVGKGAVEGESEIVDNQKIKIGLPVDVDGYKYTISVPHIPSNSYRTLTLRFKVTEENLETGVKVGNETSDYKFHLKDRLIYERVVPEFKPFNEDNRVSLSLMKRDYASKFIEVNGSDESTRHYLTTEGNGLYLGKEVTEEEVPKESDDNDGVIFNEKSEEPILYSGLNNKIQVNAKGHGFVSAWVSNVDTKSIDNVTRLEFGKFGATKEKATLVREDKDNYLEFELPDYLVEENISEVNKDFVIRVAADKAELEEKIAVTGEIEEYKVKVIQGLDAIFGLPEDVTYYPTDLGFRTSEGVLVGEYDGNLVPGETVEHTVTIINKTPAVQNKYIYFETRLGEVLFDKIEEYGDNYFQMITERTGRVISIELDKRYGEIVRYKVNFRDLAPNSSMSFKFRMKVTEKSNSENKVDRTDYELYEKEGFKVKDRLIAGQFIPDFDNRAQIELRRISHGLMERDYSNRDSEDTVIHFRAGTILDNPNAKMRTNIYKLGDIVSIENEIKTDDDTDGILLVNGEAPKVDEDDSTIKIVKLVRGQDNKVKIKVSQPGYISFWITGNNKDGDNYDWQLIGDVHKVENIENELTINSADLVKALEAKSKLFTVLKDNPDDFRYLRVRYSADREDIVNITGYARSGEVEEYKVHMRNITGVKESKEQGGDEVVTVGERITYTLKFTNDTNTSISNVVVEDDLTSVLSPNEKNVAKLDKESVKVVEGIDNVSKEINGQPNIIFDITDTKITASVINFNKKYLEITFDVVINNPLDITEKTELPNSVTIKESGVTQEIQDLEPPVLVPSEIEVKADKDYEAYRPEKDGSINYENPLEDYHAFDKNEEVDSEGNKRSVVVLPGDRVRYFIRVYNPTEFTAWSPLFVEDTGNWSAVHSVTDFIEGSFKVVKEDGETQVDLYEPTGEISREPIAAKDVKPDSKNHRIAVIIDKIEPKQYVTVIFEVKVKNEEHLPTIEYPHYLENTAEIKPTTDEKDDEKPYTKGPHLESLLKSKKTSGDDSGDRLIHPEEKFWYEIEIENYSAQTVDGISIEDDLSYMLKFAVIEKISLGIYKENNDNPYKEIVVEHKQYISTDGKLTYPLLDVLEGKERAILRIEFKAKEVFAGTGIDEDKVFYNTAYVKQPDFLPEDVTDEGLGFDVSVRIEKENVDIAPEGSKGTDISQWLDPENKVLEPFEELRYTIKLFNPSVNDKKITFTDYLTEKVRTEDGEFRTIDLFDSVDIIKDSLVVTNATSQNLQFIESERKLTGEIGMKGNSTVIIEFKAKLKVPMTDGLEAGDFLVNKADVYDDTTGNPKRNEATAEIPIDYRIQVTLTSRVLDTMTGEEVPNNPNKIVETGQTIEYTYTFINPFNKNVTIYGVDDLTEEENPVLEELENIPYFATLVTEKENRPKIIYPKGQEITEEYKNQVHPFEKVIDNPEGEKEEVVAGLRGSLIFPPMLRDSEGNIVEGSGITKVILNVIVDEELPLDIEEAIEEVLEKANEKPIEGVLVEEDAVPVHNAGDFIEERHMLESSSKNIRAASDAFAVKDPEPPLLVAIEKDEVIKISKQANKEQVSVGDLVAYELDVTNTKDSGGGLTEIRVWDKLPTGFRYVKGTARLYRKNDAGKFVKEKIDPVLSGRKMKFIIPKLKGKENFKITYILRVGTGVSPNVYENIAYVTNKKDGIISNTARALVEVLLDKLFDMSTVVGKVFHDRDGDGWQDDANAYDVKIKTLTHKDNYENVDGWYINTNKYYWYYNKVKYGEFGDLDGRELENEEIPKLILRRRIKDPEKRSILYITTDSGLRLTLLPNGKVVRIAKGALRRGEVGEDLRVNRKIVKVYGMYYEQIELYNFGIHEEGIAGAKLSTVDGLVVTTDKYGRYHIEEIPIESVRGNNFIIKVDPVTLPINSKFTTPNPLVKRIGHVMEKYNFGVQYPTDEKVAN